MKLQSLSMAAHTNHSLVVDGSGPWFQHGLDSDFSSGHLNHDLDSDFSSGYLQDALLEFTEISKRRRLLFCTNDDHHLNGFDHLSMSSWNSENFSCMSHLTTNNGISVKSGEENYVAGIKTPDKAAISSSGNGDDGKKKKRVIGGVVYPFALVKPGGIEGNITLNDINERLLMAPTRPVRHPVGDFACRPCISVDAATGLSGKPVAALTKIYTPGRGSITIIRTKD